MMRGNEDLETKAESCPCPLHESDYEQMSNCTYT